MAAVTVVTAVAVAAIATTLTVAIAAAFAATTATFAATAIAAATFAAAYEVTAAIFEDITVRAVGNRDGHAITAPQFVAGRTRGGRSGDALATDQFVVTRAMRRGDDTAVPAVEFVAGRTVRTVLMEARAASIVPSAATATAVQRQRSAGADGEKCNGEKRRQA